MAIPQGVAYAMIAGLPPVMGLYAACIPTIVGALFRSSRHVVTGPTNAVSLLVGAQPKDHRHGTHSSRLQTKAVPIYSPLFVVDGVNPLVLGGIEGAGSLEPGTPHALLDLKLVVGTGGVRGCSMIAADLAAMHGESR